MHIELAVKWPTDLNRRLARMATVSNRLGQFMPTVERLMKNDNRDGLLAGTDKDGRPLQPLATSTLLRRHFTLNTKPLIPHGVRSRAIANYKTTSFQQWDGSWLAVGAWQGVLSKKGVSFLPFHIEGAGHNPVRDIAGVRPDGKEKIRTAFREWLLGETRGQ